MALRVVSVKMPADLIEAAREYADSHGMAFSEVVRRAVREYLYTRRCPIVTRRLVLYP